MTDLASRNARYPAPPIAEPGVATDAATDHAFRHVVALSSGRSGSNRLLSLFDQHPMTNCRNEIDAASPGFMALPRPDDPDALPQDFMDRWVGLVADSRLRRGRYDDRRMMMHKAYVTPVIGRAWHEVIGRTRVRRFMGIPVTRTEWPVLGMSVRSDMVDGIIPVLKLACDASWFLGAHGALTGQTVIHNIRDPRRYASSWYNRLVLDSDVDREALYRRVVAMAGPALTAYGRPAPAERYDMRALLTVELLNWRHFNERLFLGLRQSPRYALVTYEETSKDRLGVARRVYEHANLDMDGKTLARIEGIENKIFAKPHTETLESSLVEEVVADILPGGPLADLYLKP